MTSSHGSTKGESPRPEGRADDPQTVRLRGNHLAVLAKASGSGSGFPSETEWSNGGSNPQQTSGPCVAKSAEIARESATEDDARPPEVLALSDRPDGPQPVVDPIDAALADALSRAARAGRFDVVAQLALELEARRRARTGNVVSLGAKRRDGGP